MSGLADRIRGIVTPSTPVGSGFSRTSGSPTGGPHGGGETPDIETVLGGEWRDASSTALGAGARCFIVERRMEPDARHGHDVIGTLAEWTHQGTPDASSLILRVDQNLRNGGKEITIGEDADCANQSRTIPRAEICGSRQCILSSDGVVVARPDSSREGKEIGDRESRTIFDH